MKTESILLPEKGRAVVVTEELDVENLAENEAVIRAEASMISAGTELSRVFAIKEGFSYPVRPGYSAAGVVLAKGKGLEDLQVGDRVFYSGPHQSVCRFSRGGRTQGPRIFKLPQGMDAKAASAITLGLVAISGVHATEVKLGDTLAVFGLGTIGLIAALLYQKQGARVIAVDPVESRCALARRLGIAETLSCPPDRQVEALRDLTGGRGVDIAVDVTGVSAAIEHAVLSCGKYGQAVLLGSPRAAYDCNITPLLSAIHMKMLRVVGAFNSLYPVYETEGSRLSVARNFQVICRLIQSGELDIEALVSHVIRPEEAEEAYHGLMYDREYYRCVVIDWSDR